MPIPNGMKEENIMKTINLFLIGAWGILALCLLPMKSLALEDPESTFPSEFKEKSVDSQAESRAGMDENSTAKQVEMKDQELLFGKIADLHITHNRSTLVLVKPDVPVEPSGTPAAESSLKMTMNEETEVTDGTEKLGLDDLKIGQHVRVMYEKTWFGRHVVQAIVIQK